MTPQHDAYLLCMLKAVLLVSASVACLYPSNCGLLCRLMHQSRPDMGSTGMAAQCLTTKQALW